MSDLMQGIMAGIVCLILLYLVVIGIKKIDEVQSTEFLDQSMPRELGTKSNAVRVFKDTNGCYYLYTVYGGLHPRLNNSGSHICKEIENE